MGIYFIEHAEDFFIKRRISLQRVKETLKKGTRFNNIYGKPSRRYVFIERGRCIKRFS